MKTSRKLAWVVLGVVVFGLGLLWRVYYRGLQNDAFFLVS